MAEIPMLAVLDVGADADISLGDVYFNRAHRAIADAGLTADFTIVGEEYDRALRGTIDGGDMAEFEVLPNSDRGYSAIVDAGLGADFNVIVSSAQCMKADLVVGLTGEMQALLSADRRVDLVIDAGEIADLEVRATADKYMLGNLNVGENADLQVEYLMRRILGQPPEGDAVILARGGDRALDGCSIKPGTTKVIELSIRGERLDCYRIHFALALEPADFDDPEKLITERIYDNKMPNKGGITLVVPPKIGADGREEMIAQITLLPRDTLRFIDTPRTTFYRIRLTDGPPGEAQYQFGELYDIESGRIAIAMDGEE